ncbi:hypothetical protein PR048_004473 [Dryococelus australis]|uniref:Uncharacterized protein n=1 Tax=Dryococelus australis TaxID=614101 RepID=A0ABQ9I5J0_9NEOP|nr:hypothetical protein PR048_004473 [Dryococelus australis]
MAEQAEMLQHTLTGQQESFQAQFSIQLTQLSQSVTLQMQNLPAEIEAIVNTQLNSATAQLREEIANTRCGLVFVKRQWTIQVAERISIVKQPDEQLEDFLGYELAAYPLSLFNECGMCKGINLHCTSHFKHLTKCGFEKFC